MICDERTCSWLLTERSSGALVSCGVGQCRGLIPTYEQPSTLPSRERACPIWCSSTPGRHLANGERCQHLSAALAPSCFFFSLLPDFHRCAGTNRSHQIIIAPEMRKPSQ